MVNESEELIEIRECCATVVLVDSLDYAKYIVRLVRQFLEKGYIIYYLTFNKSYDVLTQMFQKGGVDAEKIMFIEAVPNAIGKGRNCIHLENPADLMSISVVLAELANSASTGKKLFFLDSLSTFELYVPQERLVKFLHMTVNRLVIADFTTVLYSTENMNEKILASLGSVCDAIVRIKHE